MPVHVHLERLFVATREVASFAVVSRLLTLTVNDQVLCQVALLRKCFITLETPAKVGVLQEIIVFTPILVKSIKSVRPATKMCLSD